MLAEEEDSGLLVRKNATVTIKWPAIFRVPVVFAIPVMLATNATKLAKVEASARIAFRIVLTV